MRALLLVALAGMVLAGCIQDDSPIDPPQAPDTGAYLDTMPVLVDAEVLLAEKVVAPAQSWAADLYEPTLDVSQTGVIYIAGHTIGADTTGAPAYFSRDDGATWEQLPFAGPAQLPGQVHGGTPPPSDEIFIVAGDDGWAYGVDITLFTFPVNMWSGDGEELRYHNPDAYDVVSARTQPCSIASLNDRPWAAYANGTLLMVNNPGGGPVQVGVMDVPPAVPVGGPPVPGVMGPTWNLCASPGGWIPGIPDMRDDGRFVVPQVENDNDRLIVVAGDKRDVFDVDVVEVFPVTSGGGITSNYGHAVFDANGTLFVGIQNNSIPDAEGFRDGRLKIAVSTDAGMTFQHRTFTTDRAVQHIYMDGNMHGPGALVVWAVPGDQEGRSDWYTGQLRLGDDGGPVLEQVALVIEDGPRPSAHVTGAGVGPDGRAYLAMYSGGGAGSTPISVWVQEDGPTLPIFV